jgi:hypothetical protein
MKIEDFTREAEAHLEALEDLVTASVRKTGDKEEDCQQLVLLNALNRVGQAVNGTTQDDLV